MDEGRLQAWLDGASSGMSEEERLEIRIHLDSCEACSARLADLQAGDEAAHALLSGDGDEATVPDFSAIVARAAEIEGAPEDTPAPTPQPRRRLPLGWAATVVLALGVGWMANEVARTTPEVIFPATESVPVQGSELRSADLPTVTPASSAEGSGAASSPPSQTAGTVPAAAASRAPVAAPAPAPVESREDANSGTRITGRVTDATSGRPLGTAQVSLPDLGEGTVTDQDGRFTIELPPGSDTAATELRVDIIGYTSLARPVRVARGELELDDLRLNSTALRLQELVVTGVAEEAPQADPSRLRPQTAGDAAERPTREPSLSSGVPVVPTELNDILAAAEWEDVDPGGSDARLGFTPMVIGGLPVVGISRTTMGGVPFLRIAQQFETRTVTLYQSILPVEAGSPAVGARRSREVGGLRLVIEGVLNDAELEALLDRLEPVGSGGR